MIGLSHFWGVREGDAETYSIWQDKFPFLIFDIEYGNGFTGRDFT
jgi:hypothetical protein